MQSKREDRNSRMQVRSVSRAHESRTDGGQSATKPTKSEPLSLHRSEYESESGIENNLKENSCQGLMIFRDRRSKRTRQQCNRQATERSNECTWAVGP